MNKKPFDWTRPLSTHEVMQETFKELDEKWAKEDKLFENKKNNS